MDDRNFVLDATMGLRGGMGCFCPVEMNDAGEITAIITGMNYISACPPNGGKLIAIVHEDGQDAVEHFCEVHAEFIAAMEVCA